MTAFSALRHRGDAARAGNPQFVDGLMITPSMPASSTFVLICSAICSGAAEDHALFELVGDHVRR